MELIMTTREYYLQNLAKVRAANQAYKDAHREEVRVKGRAYQKKLRSTEEGRQRSNATVRRYAKRNPEKVAAATQVWFDAHPDYNREYIMKRAKQDPRMYLFNQAKRRARIKDVEFSITLDDVVVPDICPVLGVELQLGLGKRGRANFSPSLDRIDNTKGYVKGNVAVMSMRANWLKADATLAELKKVVAYLERR